MTYTQRAGFPQYNEYGGSSPPLTSIPLLVTLADAGDLVIVVAHCQAVTSTVTSITDSNNRVTWQSSALATVSPSSGDHVEIWWGVTKASGGTGSSSVTINWAATVDDGFIYVDEWGSSSGSTWSASGAAMNSYNGVAATSPANFASVTSGANGGMYWGYLYGGGYFYPPITPSNWGNLITQESNSIMWSPSGSNLAANTGYQPACTQYNAAGGTGGTETIWADGVSGIFAATGGGSSFVAPPPFVKAQSVMYRSWI